MRAKNPLDVAGPCGPAMGAGAGARAGSKAGLASPGGRARSLGGLAGTGGAGRRFGGTGEATTGAGPRLPTACCSSATSSGLRRFKTSLLLGASPSSPRTWATGAGTRCGRAGAPRRGGTGGRNGCPDPEGDGAGWPADRDPGGNGGPSRSVSALCTAGTSVVHCGEAGRSVGGADDEDNPAGPGGRAQLSGDPASRCTPGSRSHGGAD
jgi:hypothetical protein